MLGCVICAGEASGDSLTSQTVAQSGHATVSTGKFTAVSKGKPCSRQNSEVYLLQATFGLKLVDLAEPL